MKTIKPGGYKKLPLAILLVCGVNGANADILTKGPVTDPINPSTNSAVPTADIFLTVWDQQAAKSYEVDLGVNIHVFQAEAATTNLTWDLDSSFQSFNNTGDPLTFNVAAVDKNGGVTSGATLDSVMESYPTGPSAFAATLNGANLNGLQTNVVNYIQSASTTGEIITDPTNAAYFNNQFWA